MSVIKYSLFTNPGDRDYNEDAVGVEQVEGKYCFVLADGLGGHGGGAEASELVVTQVKEVFSREREVSVECMKKCFETAQEHLLLSQKEQGRANEMKTTLVVLMMDEHKVLWGHIGDSRLYLFKKGKYVLHTLDHSVPQMLVNLGEIKEKDIRHHEDRNRLLKVMGIEWDEPKYQISEEIEKTRDMSFLLCSDGFWELIEEKKMESGLFWSKNPRSWVEKMVKRVKRNGKNVNMDNYSAVAVWKGEK